MSAFRLLYQTVNQMTLFSKSGSYSGTNPKQPCPKVRLCGQEKE
jgi:hypothetical protein